MGRMSLTQLSLCIFIFALSCLPPVRVASEEVEDESEFSYVKEDENGPARWGEIRAEWRMCTNGSMQSPIDLMSERVEVVSHVGMIKRSYHPSVAILKNRGHDIMLRWEGGAGFMDGNGTRYVLRQCHWHSPSEHAIDGKRFALELHLVHESPTGEVAVVGVMYRLGRPDSFLSLIMNPLRAMAQNGEAERAIGVVDPKGIKLGSRKYYRYMGSLTVPPCTQNVQWIILRKVRTVGREQVRLLRDSVHDDAESNARPLQHVNRRNIQLYRSEENDLDDDDLPFRHH